MRAVREGDRERALKGIREITAGFVGTVDMPSLAMLPELMELYPDPKVVMITQDPEKWWESFKPVMDNSLSAVHEAMMAIDPEYNWFPAFVDECNFAIDPILERIGRKHGDLGPCIIFKSDV